MAQNYGYETLMTELPTYMKQVLRFSIKEVSSFSLSQQTHSWIVSRACHVERICHSQTPTRSSEECLSLKIMKISLLTNSQRDMTDDRHHVAWKFITPLTNMASFPTLYYYFLLPFHTFLIYLLFTHTHIQNGFLSALPYLAMWICSNMFSFVADWMIESGKFSHTVTRKIVNSIGQYGAAICLVIASFTGCSRFLTVSILTIGLGLNGAIYSGKKFKFFIKIQIFIYF